MIVPNRRGFLVGLVSACAAPAIITSAGFRPAILLPRCHERWLAVYDSPFDRFFVRGDFAKHELPIPRGVEVIPRHLVERIKAGIPDTMRVIMGRVAEPGLQQHGFNWTLSAMRAGAWHETSIEKSIERGLEIFGQAPGLGVVRVASTVSSRALTEESPTRSLSHSSSPPPAKAT